MECDRINAGIPADLPQEHVMTLAAGGQTRIERIVSRGHASPPGFWYDQPEHEWVMVVEGEALLRFEDSPEPLRLAPGCHVNIAARRRHRVEWTAPDRNTIWLAVFYGAN